ncbi:LysE family translocator [Tropicibacter sp. Alg240-R139]|uniref:LysE family translocator n=1 Tax=Tropicibacter sp. Alg240-R139 TaxID=2305991 RepID=UPI0013DED067|nr:LysE family translocator [Tropicibacter sp. Alg240-R139]
MTVTPWELTLYAGALLVLFLTPGPVWLAIIARSLSGGFQAAWPLALGVAIGDIIWPLLAIIGVSWLVNEVEGFMTVLRYVASGVFLLMGVSVLRQAGNTIRENRALTKPGKRAGFMAGLIVILANPKAILFYMGMLPGFFDLSQITPADIAPIIALSFTVPLLGNLAFALFIDRVRGVLTSPLAIRRTNIVAGCLLICVGLIIPFT